MTIRIGGALAPDTTTARERSVEAQRTPVTSADLRGAITRALQKVDGSTPKSGLVDVLTAHASLETASGASMYNFNFGGIKGHAPDGGTAQMRTHEVVAGREVATRDGFRAYATLDDGALDYVRTMKGRFSGALAPAAQGDVAGFAGALKRAGYYTASESDYAHGLSSLMGASGGAASQASASMPRQVVRPLDGSGSSGLGLTGAGLSRVGDALDADRFYTALSPSKAHKEPESDEDDS